MANQEESFPSRKAVAAAARKPMNLAGKYRVKEGYQIAYGERVDIKDTVGKHPLAKAGDIIELTHEEAVSIIRNTSGPFARRPDGRQHGPAIESESAYTARLESERQRDEFMESLAGIAVD